MTGFDIAVLLLIGLGAITGFMRGFVQEILSLAAWVFALFAIHMLHSPLTDFLLPYVKNASGSSLLALAILMLVPYAAVKAGARWAGNNSRASFLGPIDRVLGFGFGAVKGTIIAVLAFSILVLGFDLTWGYRGRPTWITQSRTYPFINAGGEKLVAIIAERRAAGAAVEADAKAVKEAKRRRRN
jgi:membrane protein required for colicin V production